MKALLWKIRFASRFWWLTRVPVSYAWNSAGAWLEDVLDGDTSESPKVCVEEEIERSMEGE